MLSTRYVSHRTPSSPPYSEDSNQELPTDMKITLTCMEGVGEGSLVSETRFGIETGIEWDISLSVLLLVSDGCRCTHSNINSKLVVLIGGIGLTVHVT